MDASVIVAAFNEQRHISEQLAALSQQDFEGDFEVLVCDNGSTDRTPEIVREWQIRDPRIRLVEATEFGRGAGQARNVGARLARSEYLAFCDADDVVSSQWLRYLVAAMRDNPVVCCRSDIIVLNPKWTRIARQVPEGIQHDIPLPALSAGNCGITASAFHQVGGYDPHVGYLEDVDISWRLQFAGYAIAYEPKAVANIRLRRSVNGLFRQGYNYGRGLKILEVRHRENLPKARRFDQKTRRQGRIDAIFALLRAFAASPILGGWGFFIWQLGWAMGHRSEVNEIEQKRSVPQLHGAVAKDTEERIHGQK